MASPPRKVRQPAAKTPPASPPATPAAESATAPAASASAPEPDEERRSFAVTMDVWHDGELFILDGDRQPRLTRAQFDRLKAGQAIDGDWDA